MQAMKLSALLCLLLTLGFAIGVHAADSTIDLPSSVIDTF